LVHNWTGKKHSEETKQKMKKSKNAGIKNASFGTCWITKDDINKKITIKELQSFINVGWIKGRKMNKKE
jgi:hypothetical protein